jgi:hypothetical protein
LVNGHNAHAWPPSRGEEAPGEARRGDGDPAAGAGPGHCTLGLDRWLVDRVDVRGNSIGAVDGEIEWGNINLEQWQRA